MHLLSLLLVIEQDLTITEVLALNASLGFLEKFGVAREFARLVGTKFDELLVSLRTESNQQTIVVQGHKLTRATRIALTTTASDQLTVDAGRIVQFSADHVESTCSVDSFAQLNVGSATRHIRGNRHFARLSSTGNDLCFRFDLMSIEHFMLDTNLF